MAALPSGKSATPLNLVSFLKLVRVYSVLLSSLLVIWCTRISG